MQNNSTTTIISIASIIVGLIATFAGAYTSLMLSSIRREIDSLKKDVRDINKEFIDLIKEK
jgi:uncharacterized membrane protein YvbJ